jgi:hypothetical protein|tara:strand:- start:250 stop:579 length:330 start_codon:yes stop_codon:yes gene_type:complete
MSNAKALKNDTSTNSLTERFAKNAKKKATFGQVQKVVGNFIYEVGVPTGINYVNLRAHFLAKLNAKKGYLTQGQVQKYLEMDTFPQEVAQEVLAYKLSKVVNKTSRKSS